MDWILWSDDAAIRGRVEDFGAVWSAEPGEEPPRSDEQLGHVLVGAGSAARAALARWPAGDAFNARVRVVVTDGDADGLADDRLHAVLPPGADPTAAIRSARALLRARADNAAIMADMSELNQIGIALTVERDLDKLLNLVVASARRLTRADAGSLYLVDGEGDDARLVFVVAQNESLEVPFKAMALPLTQSSIAGYVALTGQTVNLADAADIPSDAPYRFNRSFDELNRYRTISVLGVPMRTPQGHIVGVLQLINCKRARDVRLSTPEDFDALVETFGPRTTELARSLAAQAAVSIDNTELVASIKNLFEGFVKAAVTAIEARDPTTSGHSFRVAELTVALAEVTDRAADGPFADVRFRPAELTELRYAALLHDFGKVGVREHVLVKAKKLLPEAELDVRRRFELLRQALIADDRRRRLEVVMAHGRAGYEAQRAELDAAYAARAAELERMERDVFAANEPNVLAQAAALELETIERDGLRLFDGTVLPVLHPAERRILSIPRGSLTTEERVEIESHVTHTFEFLRRIPWTRELARVPEIAAAHHEKLDGTGYPRRLPAEQIPLQARMMAIADIFDALVAADRPYKRALPYTKALDILRDEAKGNKIDGRLLELFIDTKTYERTLTKP